MTNYSMQKGRARNDMIVRIKIIVLVLIMIFCIAYIVTKSFERDLKIMDIEYCWDSEGEHYLSPNPNCR